MAPKSPPQEATRVITADDIDELTDYDPEEQGGPNNTDLTFPPNWGLFSEEQRAGWYERVRVERQAKGQDTAIGRRARADERQRERLDTASFRHDGSGE